VFAAARFFCARGVGKAGTPRAEAAEPAWIERGPVPNGLQRDCTYEK
jgi:hypothetical protein